MRLTLVAFLELMQAEFILRELNLQHANGELARQGWWSWNEVLGIVKSLKTKRRRNGWCFNCVVEIIVRSVRGVCSTVAVVNVLHRGQLDLHRNDNVSQSALTPHYRGTTGVEQQSKRAFKEDTRRHLDADEARKWPKHGQHTAHFLSQCFFFVAFVLQNHATGGNLATMTSYRRIKTPQ